jgi:putative PIN family toxin of toxin-antitoxin system
LAENRRVQIFVSLAILQEIHRVLEYEKILRILKRSGKEPSSIMATIVSLCTLVEVKSNVQVIREDTTDNQVLACAKDAAADFILTGDRHLLQLGVYEGIRVLAASSFIESRRNKDPI